MKTALYLLGLLRDRYGPRADGSRDAEKGWRAKYEEYEKELPEPAKRTVEQWEKLVDLTGELYYAMADSSNMRNISSHLENLYAAIEEQAK